MINKQLIPKFLFVSINNLLTKKYCFKKNNNIKYFINKIFNIASIININL